MGAFLEEYLVSKHFGGTWKDRIIGHTFYFLVYREEVEVEEEFKKKFIYGWQWHDVIDACEIKLNYIFFLF